MKKTILVKSFLGMCLFLSIADSAFSENSGIKLNSNDGSTKFIVQDNAAVTVFSADSDGNTVINGTATITGSGFSVGGSTFMVKGGNVGIGTTAPATKLHIAGVDNSNGITLQGSTAPGILFKETDQTLPAGYWRLVEEGDSFIIDRNLSGDGSFSSYGRAMSIDGSGNVSLGGHGSGSWSTSMYVKGNSGNVGIGTTAPQKKLHVYGAGADDLLMLGQGNNPNETSAVFKMTSNSGNGLLEIGVSRSTVGNGNIGLATGGGNVGIGTTSPQTLLDVAGGIGTYSRTISQLMAVTPSAVGQIYYCNNCSPKKMVVSTGTSAGNFASIDGGTFQ